MTNNNIVLKTKDKSKIQQWIDACEELGVVYHLEKMHSGRNGEGESD